VPGSGDFGLLISLVAVVDREPGDSERRGTVDQVDLEQIAQLGQRHLNKLGIQSLARMLPQLDIGIEQAVADQSLAPALVDRQRVLEIFPAEIGK
jgi:hypothetical protein